MNDLMTGAALALVLEGVCYALMPGTMRRLAARMAETPTDRLRWAGLGRGLHRRRLGVAGAPLRGKSAAHPPTP
ncbi:DUF2065 domain-containing protein, partial [Nitrospirillum viridazoti]|uniref:DUF2065 domain-containing protein n=1 Tax=Nitrospirillum viridazoti TaxID=3144925 RepID=UPI001FCAE479